MQVNSLHVLLLHNSTVVTEHFEYVLAGRQVFSMYLPYYLNASMCAGTTKRWGILSGVWTWLAFLTWLIMPL